MKEKRKQTIIILEGHDMAGKTSIIKELSKHFCLPIFDLVKNMKQWDHLVDLFYGVETSVQMFEQIGCSAIIDRFYPSEYAYSQALGRYTHLDKIFEFDERMSKLNTFIIFCYKDKEHHQDDDQHFIETSKYDELTQKYIEFKNHSKCKTLLINTSNENIEEQLKTIINFVN